MRITGMEYMPGMSGFGPENIGAGRVGFLIHGSTTGDFGLDCLIGCLCFLIGIGVTFGVKTVGVEVTIRFGTGVAGEFGTGVVIELVT